MQDAVTEYIEKHEDHVLEGAFLDPNLIIKLGRPILVIVNDEARHKKLFLTHREKLLDFRGNEFKAARMIQDYLIDEARQLGIEVINNDRNSVL